MGGNRFKLNDGDGTMLIRSMDVMDEAKAMARRLGISGQIEVMVGRWDENGQQVGWTKKLSDGDDEILVEVFVSDLNGENREFDRYAREMKSLLAENAELKRIAKELVEAATPFIERLAMLESNSRKLDCGVPNETNVRTSWLRRLDTALAPFGGKAE